MRIDTTIVQRYNLPEGSFTIAQGPAGEMPLPEGEEGEAVELRGTTGTLYTEEDGGRVLLTWVQAGDPWFSILE